MKQHPGEIFHKIPFANGGNDRCWHYPDMSGCLWRYCSTLTAANFPGGQLAKPTRLSRLAQTRSRAPPWARATHIVQLGTIFLIGQRCPAIVGEHGAQFQSRGGESCRCIRRPPVHLNAPRLIAPIARKGRARALAPKPPVLICRRDVLTTVEQPEMSKWTVILLLVHRPLFEFN
jgi:hypothetical protein